MRADLVVRRTSILAGVGLMVLATGIVPAQAALWLQDYGTAAPFPLYLYHYSHGHFTRYTMPHGSDVNLLSFAWIPGTRSVWAAGTS